MNYKKRELIEARIKTLRRQKGWQGFMCIGFIIAGICTLAILIGIVFLIVAGIKGKRIKELEQEIARLEIDLEGD